MNKDIPDHQACSKTISNNGHQFCTKNYIILSLCANKLQLRDNIKDNNKLKQI